jgi:hypothetical protein
MEASVTAIDRAVRVVLAATDRCEVGRGHVGIFPSLVLLLRQFRPRDRTQPEFTRDEILTQANKPALWGQTTYR